MKAYFWRERERKSKKPKKTRHNNNTCDDAGVVL
jgi:hypothetical protein